MQIKDAVPVKLIKDHGVLVIRILYQHYVIIILQMKKFQKFLMNL